MTKTIICLTFIPWILYFLSVSLNAVKDLNKNTVTGTWLKENVFNIFHFDNIILIGIFIYFSRMYPDANQIFLVETLLFTFINLYLYLNSYYDKNNKKEKITVNDIPTILILVITMLIPVIHYLSSGDYLVAYYIMFGYSFFNYVIVYISKIINNKIIKIITKNNESK